jgi:predicted RNA-binding Zn ribbon-like protein
MASVTDWKAGFLFLGNNLALDFLNTRPVLNGKPEELLPDLGALLRWFRAAGLLAHGAEARFRRRWSGSATALHTVAAMRRLREKLRKGILSWEQFGSVPVPLVAELNKLLGDYPVRSRLQSLGSAFSMQLSFDPASPEDLLAPLAHAAATLFATAGRDRVRKCGNCVLHFYDTSKKGTRRWCSMRLCGNRLKVAAYAARRRRRRLRLHV